MSIGQVMSKKLITLSMDDDLEKAKNIFDNNKIHHILITNGEELAGVVTDRDIYKHLSPTIGTNKETARDNAMLQKKLHLIMSRDLITASPETSLNVAVLQFYDNHISCLPIVDEQLKLLGIITWRDIIKILALQYRQKSNDNT